MDSEQSLYRRIDHEYLKHIPQQERERADYIEGIAERMASQIRHGSGVLLDVDGVILESDSLQSPAVTSQALVEQIRSLETIGVQVGLATARSEQSLHYLRYEHGLALTGTSILEEGQVRIVEGVEEQLATESVVRFMREAHLEFKTNPFFVDSWDEVKKYFETEEFRFCHGNQQWQGKLRRSVWFYSDYDTEKDEDIRERFFVPVLEHVARNTGINVRQDISIGVSHMKVGNLGMVGMKGTQEGKPINKAVALEGIPGNFVFIADGMGDLELSRKLKRRGGMVIGIEGNLDDSPDPDVFLETSDGVLKDPSEFALTLAAVHKRLSSCT